jgi:hypothetical protein
MLKSRLRITSCFLWVTLTLLGFYPSSPAHADSFRTEGASNFYFELEAGTTFTLRTYAQQYGIDSQLWLYNSNNQVVAVNDDYYGLDSYISYAVQQAGTYRLRTSICCGNPDAWRGTFYIIETSFTPTVVPVTTTTSTTTTTTTTTLPPLIMASPTNLRAVAHYQSVSLTWDAPQEGTGYASPERYAIFFTSDNWQTSYAIASTDTSATVENLINGTEYQFRVRADNDTLHVYSSMIETYTVSATPVTTTTTTLRPTTTTSTTTSSVPVPPTEPSSTVVVTTSSSTSTTTTTIARTTTTSVTPTTLVVVPSTTSLAPTTTLPESTTSSTSSTTIAPQTDPQQVVDAEVLTLLNAISDLPQKEIQAAVDNIIEKGVSAAEAEELATNPDVIQSVSAEQAAEIFDAVEVSDLSEAQAEQLVEAVQGATEEVRAEFEDKINVFGGKFDKYVPIGSKVSVAVRKVLVAASGVLFMSPTVSVSTSGSSSSATESKSRRKK